MEKERRGSFLGIFPLHSLNPPPSPFPRAPFRFCISFPHFRHCLLASPVAVSPPGKIIWTLVTPGAAGVNESLLFPNKSPPLTLHSSCDFPAWAWPRRREELILLPHLAHHGSPRILRQDPRTAQGKLFSSKLGSLLDLPLISQAFKLSTL